MNLKEYFGTTDGMGVLCTADRDAVPNSAVYAKPHVFSEDTIAFIMRDRLSHANVTENPKANYMFVEHTHGVKGVRLLLDKIDEITDKQTIEQLSRRSRDIHDDELRYLVSFRVTRAMTIVGGIDISINGAGS